MRCEALELYNIMIQKGRTLDVVLCGTIKCEVGKMKEGHDLLRVFAVGL